MSAFDYPQKGDIVEIETKEGYYKEVRVEFA